MKDIMKKCVSFTAILILFMGVFLISMPSAANASMYNMLSTNQSIEGHFYEYVTEFLGVDETGEAIYNYDTYSDYFYDSSTTPANLSKITSGGLNSFAEATSTLLVRADGFDAFNSAIGKHGTGDYLGGISISADYHALSELELIFAPNESSRWQFDSVANYPLYYGGYGTISLLDLATQNTLFNDFGSYEFILDSSHNYKLNMSISNNYSGTITAFVSPVPSSPVPIPAAIWLFGSGLIGLIGLRKRFKK